MKTQDLIGTIILTLAIGLALGYAWAKSQSELNYEQGFIKGLSELTVLVKGEICDSRNLSGSIVRNNLTLYVACEI